MNTWHGKYAALVLTAVGGLCAYNWIGWAKLTASDWGTWFGALGTLGALIGTIWIATFQERKKAEDARELAILVAIGLDIRLVGILKSLEGIHHGFGEDYEEREAPRFRAYAEELDRAGNWSMSEIVPLVALGNNIASRLARAASHITFCKNILLTASESHQEVAVQINIHILELLGGIKFDVGFAHEQFIELVQIASEPLSAEANV
jgi:hypothetical protein